jgi:hypothetical protein
LPRSDDGPRLVRHPCRRCAAIPRSPLSFPARPSVLCTQPIARKSTVAVRCRHSQILVLLRRSAMSRWK